MSVQSAVRLDILQIVVIDINQYQYGVEEVLSKQNMQVRQETIYTYLYRLSKGELCKELIVYPRQKKKLRKSRKNSREKCGKIPDIISIHVRPKQVDQRIIPEPTEGDALIGKDHQ